VPAGAGSSQARAIRLDCTNICIAALLEVSTATSRLAGGRNDALTSAEAACWLVRTCATTSAPCLFVAVREIARPVICPKVRCVTLPWSCGMIATLKCRLGLRDAIDGYSLAKPKYTPRSPDTNAFVDLGVKDMEPNEEACEASVEKSLSMVTSLNPHIGYEKAAALAKEAFKTGKTIRELCQEKNVLADDVLTKALDPWSMTEPK